MGQELFQHGNLEGRYIHRITRWRFVDTAARMDPANLFTFRDLDKVAYDMETGEYYVLHSIAAGYIPEWKLISAVEAQGESNTLYKVGTGVGLDGPKVGTALGVRSLAGTLNQIDVIEQPDGTVKLSFTNNFVLTVEGKANVLDLGTAAYEDMDLSPIATGLELVRVMRKGQYGVGWRSIPTTDLDSIYENGFYSAIGTPTGGIGGTTGMVNYLVHKGDVDIGYQLGVYDGPIQMPMAYMRVVKSFDGGPVWGPWAKLTHSYNILEEVKTIFPMVLSAGTNITLDYNPTTHVTTVSSTGGGGGGATNLSYTPAPSTGTVVSDTGTDAIITLANVTNAGLLSPADFTKLSGLPSSFNESVQDVVAGFMVAGANITLTYDDVANTLTVASTGGGGGGGATNLAYTASPTNGVVTSDTGTDATLTLVDATNAGLMAPAQHTKLAGIATAATANSSDSFLLSRANHTGTQTASTISDLTEVTQDMISTFLVAGTNVTLTYNDVSNTLTIAATGGGGGGATNLGYTASPTNGVVTSDTGTDATITLADATNAGLQSPAQYTKVDGLPADLAEYVRDTVAAFLVNGTNITITHNDGADTLTISRTGSQDVSTISNFEEAVQDIIGFGALTAGTNISLSYNDAGNTLTINGVLTPDVAAIEALTGTTGLLRKTAADTWTLDTNTYLTANETVTLSGDVTGSGTTAITTAIANDAVTFAKMQNISTAKLLGRATSGSGDIEEITLGTNLSFTGTTLNAAGGGGGGATNLSIGTVSTTTVEILSDTGTDATIPAATNTSAGVVTAAQVIEIEKVAGKRDYNIADVMFESDFLDTTTTAALPWTGSPFGSGSPNNTASVTSLLTKNFPGLVKITSGTSANSGYRYAANGAIVLAGGYSSTSVLAPSGLTDTVTKFGFMDTSNNIAPADGAFFEIAGTAVSCKTYNNNANTSVSMGTLSADTFYKFVVNFTSDAACVFTIYDTAGSVVATETVTTNLAVNNSARATSHALVGYCTAAAATAVCTVDYMNVRFSGLVR